MKKYFFPAIVLLALTTLHAQNPEGSYIIRAAQYGDSVRTSEQLAKQKTIKVFKDGYWIAAFYREPDKAFVGSGGGTFTIRDGKYVEKVNFFSWDNTAADSVYTFSYQLTPDKYQQEGRINSKNYSNYIIKEDYDKIKPQSPLQNSSLEGAWEIQEGTWTTGKLGEGAYAGMTGIKIYAYPMVVFGFYKPATKEFVAAGGGTYQYDGKNLTENLEFFSLGNTALPASIKYNVQTNGRNIYRQSGVDGNTNETWKRISNQ